MPKVLAVPSEQATNETSRLIDKPPITKEESKILACLHLHQHHHHQQYRHRRQHQQMYQ